MIVRDSMAEGALDPRIEHLKQLQSDPAVLSQSRNDICAAHLEQLEQIRARKHHDLERWRMSARSRERRGARVAAGV